MRNAKTACSAGLQKRVTTAVRKIKIMLLSDYNYAQHDSNLIKNNITVNIQFIYNICTLIFDHSFFDFFSKEIIANRLSAKIKDEKALSCITLAIA